MRLQLEQRNNRKKLKEPQKTPSIIRELHCIATATGLIIIYCNRGELQYHNFLSKFKVIQK